MAVRFPFKWRSPKSQKDMRSSGNYAGKDSSGNWWYLNELLQNWNGSVFRDGRKNKIDFDMSRDMHKRLALEVCPPFSIVINQCGSYFSNAKTYVQDIKGNEIVSNDAKAIRQLLNQPNPLQSGRQFLKQVEICLKAFGYCPVYTLRGMRGSIPSTMAIIPPEIFHQETTGKYFEQVDRSGIIKEAYIEWNGTRKKLDESDYFVIVDSEIAIKNNHINYSNPVDTLSHPINNWMAQMISRGTLITNGGPKGIIHGDDNSEYQNAALTEKEKKEMNEHFKEKYGLVNKLYSIWVTRSKVGWLPLSFDVGQLKLHEEDKACIEIISNAIGLDPSVLSVLSKYDNKTEAKRSAYQDLIIPDAENCAETITNHICPDGLFVKFDYSHLPVLQKDKQSESQSLRNISTSLISLLSNNILTREEARVELSRYIDINPKDISNGD